MEPNLKKSFILLKRISRELEKAGEGLRYLAGKKMDVFNDSNDQEEIFHLNTCMYGLIYFSFIRYDTFIEEYQIRFNSPLETDREKIKVLRNKCKEYISNVKDIFGDIKQARNTILAHGYRNRSDALDNQTINTIYDRLLSHNNLEPFTQLSNTSGLIMKAIEKEFGMLSEEEISFDVPEESLDDEDEF